MTYYVKTELPCVGCGFPTGARVGKRKEPKCFDCSLKAAADSARDLANKSGPYWEAWLAGQKRYMENIESRSGEADATTPPTT